MDDQQARARAEEWISAWNAHDIERILSHYTDDFEMSSSFIQRVVGDKTGTLHGKAAIEAYWRRGFERAPHLRFELLDTLLGIDSLALYYRSTVTNNTVVEVLAMKGDKYSRGHAHYAIQNV